jgi:two-component system, chemotaxis family, CheB/CheR fusion protein
MDTVLREPAEAPSQRELQQQAVADLGQLALGGCTFDALCETAVEELGRCLNLRFVKLLELEREKNHLTIRAGRGWKSGIVGKARVPADSGSQAGFTLKTSDTVVVKDFASERRFAPPDLLREHGIRCGASVIVGPVSDPWGVLGVHESELGRCSFDRFDIDFVRSVANILWLFLRNERARQEAERQRRALRSFADAMPIFFAVVDGEGCYVFVNEAYRAFGDPSQLIGRRVADVGVPETCGRAASCFDRARAGEVTRFETKLLIGDAGRRDVLVTYAPRWRGDGATDGVYSAIVDITDQKQRQRDILERTRQYQALAESIPYGVWTCDADGRLTYVSESFLDLVGMSFEEARDFGWIDSLLPEEAEDTRASWQACVRTRGDWEREHRVIGRDGRTYDILAIARPVFDDEEDLVSYVGLNLDITERKRREETLELLARELDHRVKNAFSLVLTIARMASRSARDVETFRSAFEGRLRALASAHEVMAEGEWQGMSLRRLIEAELAPYVDGSDRLKVEGPDRVLSVECVQPLTLAVHELATNAAKYGALGAPGGHLRVRWNEIDGAGLSILWKETGLRDLEPPAGTGFGSKVLEQVLAIQLDAKVDVEFQPDGLQVRIELPPSCIGSIGD